VRLRHLQHPGALGAQRHPCQGRLVRPQGAGLLACALVHTPARLPPA
jgi:hypothetical protein